MIELQQVHRSFQTRSQRVDALKEINLTIQPGEFVAVRGPSGSGKSTLLMLLGGLLQASSGTLKVAETSLETCSKSELNRFRARKIGFVFQMFHLVPYLSVRENIRLGQTNPDSGAVNAMIEQLGLTHRAENYPATLSAGEQQRTAVGRAMIHQPPLILADEPTGNLDPDNAREVLQMLETYRKQGGTVLVVSHGEDVLKFADRSIQLKAGTIVD